MSNPLAPPVTDLTTERIRRLRSFPSHLKTPEKLAVVLSHLRSGLWLAPDYVRDSLCCSQRRFIAFLRPQADSRLLNALGAILGLPFIGLDAGPFQFRLIFRSETSETSKIALEIKVVTLREFDIQVIELSLPYQEPSHMGLVLIPEDDNRVGNYIVAAWLSGSWRIPLLHLLWSSGSITTVGCRLGELDIHFHHDSSFAVRDARRSEVMVLFGHGTESVSSLINAGAMDSPEPEENDE